MPSPRAHSISIEDHETGVDATLGRVAARLAAMCPRPGILGTSGVWTLPARLAVEKLRASFTIGYHLEMVFDLQPTLRSQLLEIRPLRADDFVSLFAVASDPLIWEQHPVNDRYKPEVFREFFQESLASGGALAVLDATGDIIGASRYHGYDETAREIEIGWTFLARRHWGGHINGEIKRLMLTHAFQFVERVVFLVDPNNVRSQHALQKIGGRREGSRVDGRGHECFLYVLTAR